LFIYEKDQTFLKKILNGKDPSLARAAIENEKERKGKNGKEKKRKESQIWKSCESWEQG
jgi:hypothetical protein